MLEIQEDILTKAIEIAVQKAGDDLSMLRAINRAVKLIEDNPYKDWTDKGLLMLSDTSGFTYLVNGECVRFEDNKEVYCPGYFFNHHICKHHAAYNLLRIHDELARASTRKDTKIVNTELLTPGGGLFVASENKVPKRVKDGKVYEYVSYDYALGGFIGGTQRVKSVYVWIGARYMRI